MFTLPDLPYAHEALEPYLDSETMHLHHDKHHAAYVKNLIDALANNPDLIVLPIEKLISELNTVPEPLRTKVKNQGGGHFNHSFFWKTMSPPTGITPGGDLLTALNATFGDISSFKEKFTTCAMSRFASGWAWLIVDQGKLSIVDSPNQDSPLSSGQKPLLCVDVWEHAYYLKYQNRRADYLSAWWNIVNWPQIEINFRS